MRAAVLRQLGPPEALVAEDVPDPQPGPDEVLVAVHAASITFVETQIRAGRPPHPHMAPALPAILGNGVGGMIAGTGEGVDPTLRGRRVVTTTGGTGGYAERVAVAAALPIAVPDDVDLPAATALLADGRTALSLIEAAAPRPGELPRAQRRGARAGAGRAPHRHRRPDRRAGRGEPGARRDRGAGDDRQDAAARLTARIPTLRGCA